MEMEKVNPLVREALSSAMMKITVELGATYHTVKEVSSMGEGTIVELNTLAGEPLDVKANGVLIAKGEAVVIDSNFGVRLTEIIGTPDTSNQSKSPTPEPPESSELTKQTAEDEAAKQNSVTHDNLKNPVYFSGEDLQKSMESFHNLTNKMDYK